MTARVSWKEAQMKKLIAWWFKNARESCDDIDRFLGKKVAWLGANAGHAEHVAGCFNSTGS